VKTGVRDAAGVTQDEVPDLVSEDERSLRSAKVGP
jgi:hypothetical protein